MDWNHAIERNRQALGRILAALLAMAGMGGVAAGSTDCRFPAADGRPTLPRHLHRAVLRLLRPAEAAARRLVIAFARGLVAPPLARTASPGRPGKAGPRKLLPLFDALPRFQPGRARVAPRISVPGYGNPGLARRSQATPFDPIDAAPLARRLGALAAVLDDLPAHARRFARSQARLAQRPAAGGEAKAAGSPHPKGRRLVRRTVPLRPGRPPGSRRRASHAVDDVLAAAHDLAMLALEPADTS